MHGGGKWDGWAARTYYVLGLLYYLYHWLVIGGVVGLVATAFAFYKRSPELVIILLLGFSLVAIAVGCGIWLRSAKRRLEGPNPGFKLLSLESSYKVCGDGKYHATRRIIARSVRAGADSYKHKFGWTGSGPIGIALVHSTPPASATIATDQLGQKTCVVQFKRQLANGEQIEFEYAMDLIDDGGTAKPFLTTNITDWISKELIMRVKLPDDCVAYRRGIYMSHAAEIPMWEDEVRRGSSHEAYWKISKPRPRYRYQIDW